MVILFLILALVLTFALPTLRCAVSHPVKVIRNGVADLWRHFRRREYNLCPTGELVAYTGLFGKGKTLSAVHRVVTAYKHYNGKKSGVPGARSSSPSGSM